MKISNININKISLKKAFMLLTATLFIIGGFFVATPHAFAATVTTAGSGNWNSTTVNAPWPLGTVPVAGSDIIIANGNTVTVTANIANSPATITINSGGQLTVGGFTLAVSGATTVSGTLAITTGTGGTKTFTGNVTINSGGVWNETVAEAVTFGGNLQNDGIFTASTGAHTFSGNGKTIGGTNAIAIPSLTITGTGASIVTNNGVLTVSTTLAGADTLANGSNATLNIGGTSSITTLTNAGTISRTGTGTTTTALANFTKALLISVVLEQSPASPTTLVV